MALAHTTTAHEDSGEQSRPVQNGTRHNAIHDASCDAHCDAHYDASRTASRAASRIAHHTASTARRREDIVTIRALAILAVMLGHSIILYSPGWNLYATDRQAPLLASLKDVVNLVQMPLFFSVSGFCLLFTLHSSRFSLHRFAVEKLRRLVVPFLCIGLLWMMPLRLAVGYPGYDGRSLGYVIVHDVLLGYDNGHLWFLPTLLLMFVVVWMLVWARDAARLPEGAFAAALIVVAVAARSVLVIWPRIAAVPYLSNCCLYLPYFVFGYLAHRYGGLLGGGRRSSGQSGGSQSGDGRLSGELSAVSRAENASGGGMRHRLNSHAAAARPADSPLRRVLWHALRRGVPGLLLLCICAYVWVHHGSGGTMRTLILTMAALACVYLLVPNASNGVLRVISRDSMGLYLFHSPLLYISFTFWPNISPWLMVPINFLGFGTVAWLLTILMRRARLGFVIGE